MKKIWKGALAAGLCVTLTACGGEETSPVQEALSFRTDLLAAYQCSFTAQVTADYGERAYTFGLDCVYEPRNDRAELTVTEPESITGITATMEGTDGTVAFDGTALELGTLASGKTAPMALPQLLGQAWTGGYIDSQTAADSGFLVTYQVGYEQDALTVYTAFDEAGVPLWAEVYDEGICVLQAELSNFAMA